MLEKIEGSRKRGRQKWDIDSTKEAVGMSLQELSRTVKTGHLIHKVTRSQSKFNGMSLTHTHTHTHTHTRNISSFWIWGPRSQSHPWSHFSSYLSESPPKESYNFRLAAFLDTKKSPSRIQGKESILRVSSWPFGQRGSSPEVNIYGSKIFDLCSGEFQEEWQD